MHFVTLDEMELYITTNFSWIEFYNMDFEVFVVFTEVYSAAYITMLL